MHKGKRNRHRNEYRRLSTGFIRIKQKSRHKRCPRCGCKKIRSWWVKESSLGSKIGPRILDGQKVCWMCWKRSEYGQIEEIMNV